MPGAGSCLARAAALNARVMSPDLPARRESWLTMRDAHPVCSNPRATRTRTCCRDGERREHKRSRWYSRGGGARRRGQRRRRCAVERYDDAVAVAISDEASCLTYTALVLQSSFPQRSRRRPRRRRRPAVVHRSEHPRRLVRTAVRSFLGTETHTPHLLASFSQPRESALLLHHRESGKGGSLPRLAKPRRRALV